MDYYSSIRPSMTVTLFPKPSLLSFSSPSSPSKELAYSVTSSSFLSVQELSSSFTIIKDNNWIPIILSFITGGIVSYALFTTTRRAAETTRKSSLSSSAVVTTTITQDTEASSFVPSVFSLSSSSSSSLLSPLDLPPASAIPLPPPQPVRQGVPDLVGRTPLVRIPSLSLATGCEIYGKAEFLNVGGSSKDRFALQCIMDLTSSSGTRIPYQNTLVEGTSGSTGISIAILARAFHYRCRVVIPDDIAPEKINLLRNLGAEITIVKPVSIVNAQHYVNIAKQITQDINTMEKVTKEKEKSRLTITNRTVPSSPPPVVEERAYFCNQFESLSNYRAHFCTTGPEIWSDTYGKLDAFIMGAGTGGTLAGVGNYLKQISGNRVQIFLVDPPGSCLYNRIVHGVAYASQQSERRLKRHRYDTIIEGVGIDRITENFRHVIPICDGGFTCTDNEAIIMARYLLYHDGLFVGSSTAMNCVGAVKLARKLGPGKRIVTLLCDSGTRHTGRFWNDQYLLDHGYTLPDGFTSPSPSTVEEEEEERGVGNDTVTKEERNTRKETMKNPYSSLDDFIEY